MNKKGFTLVELLAVVIILAVIALITTISINKTLSDSKESLSETQKNNIENAAKTYYLKEGMNINSSCVNISELLEKGYIEGKSVIDPETREEITGSVKIIYEANQYSYEYQTNACKYCTLDDKDSSGGPSLSDEVTCAGEKFYVMSTDELNNTVTTLAKYNLEVGYDWDLYSTSPPYYSLIERPSGIQNENAGCNQFYESGDCMVFYGTTYFSEYPYWDYANVADNGKYNGYQGGAWDFGTGNYDYKDHYVGEYSPAGDSDYPYVYDEHSIIYGYVENYEMYLKNLGINSADATLMSYEQARDLGCDEPIYHQSNWYADFSCSNAPEWLTSTTYWLGSVNNRPVVGDSNTWLSYVWAVNQYSNWISNGWVQFGGMGNYGAGVRPVVTISKADLK